MLLHGTGLLKISCSFNLHLLPRDTCHTGQIGTPKRVSMMT